MYNVWILALRAQPPKVVGLIQCENTVTLGLLVQAAADALGSEGGHGFTFVHEVNCAPLTVTEAGPHA